MKTVIHNIFSLLLILHASHAAGQQYRFSDGLYRVPYSNGVTASIASNVWSHSPLGCMDIIAQNCTDCGIVAAAGGWIRAIRDFHNTSCGGSSCCPEFNNFIILEHPNGEWSSYIHLKQNSITNLGHEIDDWVDVGTLLGYEGTVGCSTGQHLHLEVSRPRDRTNAWDNYDGVLRRHGELLNPVICSSGNGMFIEGQTYTAGNCSFNCATSLNLSGNVTNSVQRADNTISSTAVFSADGTGMYRAGTEIVFTPGFAASRGVMFTAQVKTCNQN
ncbi:MAG: M23 family metallopeptidase [Sphingobacteriales bacterium]|nr:MAG: M23 family metallopeptidase [Sphingobacteriales bacterium]